MAGFLVIRNIPEILKHLQEAKRRRAEACIQAGAGHMEYLL
jgi:hypothetical protein